MGKTPNLFCLLNFSKFLPNACVHLNGTKSTLNNVCILDRLMFVKRVDFARGQILLQTPPPLFICSNFCFLNGIKTFLSWLNCCLTKGWIFPEGRSCYKTRPSPHSFPRGGGFCLQQFLSQTSFQKAITPGLNNSKERRKHCRNWVQFFTMNVTYYTSLLCPLFVCLPYLHMSKP